MAGRHILFLVHGMGVYGKVEDGRYKPDTAKWFDDAKAGLVKIYDEFIKDTIVGDGAEFDDLFVVEPIEYDSQLETYRAAWEEQAKMWKVFGLDSGFAATIRKFFEGNSDDAFLWTHVADVLLYTARLNQDAIHPYVALQILQKLRERHQAADLGDWSIVAHSLGTAVMNDAAPKLFADAKADPVLSAVLTPPQVICMAANVARALSPPERAYDPLLCPSGPEGVLNYLSLSHTLDPFTRIRPFRPPVDGPPWSSHRYVALSGLSGYYLANEFIDWAQHYDQFDKFAAIVPHGFDHYMRQPKVVAQLWPRLRGFEPWEVPGIEEKVRESNEKLVRKAIEEPLRQALEQEVRKRLEGALASVSIPDSVNDLVKRLPDVLRMLKGF